MGGRNVLLFAFMISTSTLSAKYNDIENNTIFYREERDMSPVSPLTIMSLIMFM